MSEMKYEMHLVDAASSAIGCPANGDVSDRPALINRIIITVSHNISMVKDPIMNGRQKQYTCHHPNSLDIREHVGLRISPALNKQTLLYHHIHGDSSMYDSIIKVHYMIGNKKQFTTIKANRLMMEAVATALRGKFYRPQNSNCYILDHTTHPYFIVSHVVEMLHGHIVHVSLNCLNTYLSCVRDFGIDMTNFWICSGPICPEGWSDKNIHFRYNLYVDIDRTVHCYVPQITCTHKIISLETPIEVKYNKPPKKQK